ncbi:unnamed protein product [Arabis nemorensis]|uniref:CCHC-type domain-containing protein n=1 Tax=Arabis nemorensis TaxID=586526 RepID=A0A565AZC7_9BRAS|nr:unnamed protein product [Arabis nemorensis]
MKQKKSRKRSSEVDSSSQNIQFECKGFGHVRSKCANLLKKKALACIKSDSDNDSDDELALNNFVALTTFVSGAVPESATEPAIEAAAETEAKLKLVEDNSVLTKEKVKLEAQVAEAQKYAVQKEDEAIQARVQLEETQK